MKLSLERSFGLDDVGTFRPRVTPHLPLFIDRFSERSVIEMIVDVKPYRSAHGL